MGCVGYSLNRLNDFFLLAWPKPLLTEFDIHQRLESYVNNYGLYFVNHTSVPQRYVYRNPLVFISGLFHTPLVPLPGFAPGGGGPVGHPQSVAAAAAVIRSTTAAVAAAAAAQAVHQQQQV